MIIRAPFGVGMIRTSTVCALECTWWLVDNARESNEIYENQRFVVCRNDNVIYDIILKFVEKIVIIL